MGVFSLNGVLVHDDELIRFVRAALRNDEDQSMSEDAAYVGKTIARMVPEVQQAINSGEGA